MSCTGRFGGKKVSQPQGLQTQVGNLRRELGDARQYVLHVTGGIPLGPSRGVGWRGRATLEVAAYGFATEMVAWTRGRCARACWILLWTSPTSARVTITSPSNGSAVPQDCRIEGTTAVPDVMVIIESDRMFFVQPKPSITGKKWSVTAYCGQEGDGGRQFFIRALGMPAKQLNPGLIGDALPEAKAYSETVVVTRQ